MADTVTHTDAETHFSSDPLWYKDAVIYQIHVKSFVDSNGDGIGDFAGLVSKLDYIAELGVNTIWLLPFYPSPRLDDGYDIAEYKAVSPDYGTLADAKRFVREAHARGMRVITELVINHTSDQHPWFQRARHAKKGSAARDFYVWSDTDTLYAGTRIIFLDTERSNWTWDPVAGQYFWHRFYSHQPDLNFDNPAVLKAVLGIMRWWLEIGIDGLRLDAIPYLIERDGTSNENLDETHDILKKIRAELDATFPDRMLLAEANMWPEDTQAYFGEGDECHMAFHFPLMPRMYMAIAQEDRFPITDIMRQTPEIPENCQWAIFLRNHDELTLEMVTDSERDYLWNFYAADRRARINLGIRRRLAPLMQRDRRRIELMNSLLLSMPGTPVLYYGDEIGMGDNIYLGDRDGVRTPMQWSPDRNGGFSKADPASLVLPPIMDPLYGYEAVNVEAQARDPHSLLNWMRRMLATRKQSQAFGRGTLRFLYPKNRKVFAYLREYDGDTILCVANLSRAAQAVELDLSEFSGRVPVEMLGGSAFPPIGQLTYLLTVQPYGFYWFVLTSDAKSPAWHTPAPEPMPDFLTFVLRGPADLINPEHRRIFEHDVLPPYLAKRRWFAAKDKAIEGIRVALFARFGREGELAIAEVEVTFAGGANERYLLPLGIVWEDEGTAALPQQLGLARVRRGRRVGYLTDAFTLPAFALDIIERLKTGASLASNDGEISFRSTGQTGAFDLPDGSVRWLTAEQSNSALIVGEKLMVKLFRKVSGGIHPEAEMGRYLTVNGFANAAPLYGEIVRTAQDGTPYVLGVIQGYIPGEGDAWAWTLNYLTRVIDEVRHETETVEPTQALRRYNDFIAMLGRRLGEMHVVLARDTDEDGFTPQAADAGTVAAWVGRISERLDEAVDILERRTSWPDETARENAQAIVTRHAAVRGRFTELAKAAEGSLFTRIHGDLHLGQVLVASGDAVLIDFEGEPSRPLSERRGKSSPWRDVAGMLRSLDYAVATVRMGQSTGVGLAADERRSEVTKALAETAPAAFLAAYHGATADTPLALDTDRQDALRDLALIEKAAYEIGYEAANRPDWIGIPVAGLATIVRRLVPSGDLHD